MVVVWRPRLPESVNTLLTTATPPWLVNHGGVAVAFNSMFLGMLLKLTSTDSFEHLCVRISSSSKSELQMRVSECVDEITSWMGANCLKLNSEKTEVIWFSSESEKYSELFCPCIR